METWEALARQAYEGIRGATKSTVSPQIFDLMLAAGPSKTIQALAAVLAKFMADHMLAMSTPDLALIVLIGKAIVAAGEAVPPCGSCPVCLEEAKRSLS